MGNRLVAESAHESSNSKNPEPNGTGSSQAQIEESSTLGSAPRDFGTREDCSNVVNSVYNFTILERIHCRLSSIYQLWVPI